MEWRVREERLMAIEIKGLSANVQAARAAIGRARAATARMNASGLTLEQTANDIAAVFEQHTADLLFEAQQLGNSTSAASGAEPQASSEPRAPTQQHPTTTVDAVRPRLDK
jgi:hypothetical protein